MVYYEKIEDNRQFSTDHLWKQYHKLFEPMNGEKSYAVQDTDY